mmetsp:Transcript_11130/g.21535  ORF Transcript_11130/g.21535 Transcript_11130/m.21535 type:complete len:426 (+) Transcript_11130:27-1304(+)|eukprot:CAMPEP_0172665716 /NCGR_PEP_ID=MMETSP1074-20121228/7411_1 /TAXON_ID=2916 /ORGANISM="Ceratium fusus, Strain PA161109" /LENGTH=425 /DNA_ID=CAMNT_0013482057 /DNA_START=25 /DNA_END=1302 /DNA_ORIENTATION=+
MERWRRLQSREPQEMADGDAALLKSLEALRPSHLTACDAAYDAWVLVPADDGCGDTEWVKTCDPQLLANASFSPQLRSALLLAAEGVEREMRWYFQERDSRIWGRRWDPLHRPCARTVFARHLRRFAATSLKRGDREQLQLWCHYLRKVVAARLFTSNNLLWPSRFEQSLAACLVRLETLQLRILQGEEEERLRKVPVCEVSREQVAAVAAKKARGGFCKARLHQIALYRYSRMIPWSMSNARMQLPLLLCMQSVERLKVLAAGVFLMGSSVELSRQCIEELRLFAAGEIDARTLAEDAVVSTGSMAAFAVGQAAVASLTPAGFCTLLLRMFGPSCAAVIVASLLEVCGRRAWGSPYARTLQGAYEALGLSRRGASMYAPAEIEAQLAWMLNEQGVDSLRLWAAYEHIRQQQHPDLADPWQPEEA